METANLPTTTTRLPLLGRAFRPRRDAQAQAHRHLHFDRAARVWLSHDELHSREPLTVALPECA